MTTFSLNSLTEALQNTRVSPSGVSFAGQSLKLDNESDAKQIVDAIEKCSNLQYLNLEGNTLGVDASKEIAKALEKHPEFVRALWKDMFTGRMKTEIPKALQYLGNSLVTAGARLMELDLSDNAFGPIGVEGLASLLRSSTCHALEELRLNNNGLGVTGGRLLASALTDCYNFSKKGGKPLSLKVFIAGRNRLENDGAKALAQVFKMIGTLEEISMPQNGIYHVGIAALSEALTCNKNLHILNLNDNTITAKGAEAIAKALPHLQQLRVINFGDCLLKTKGTELLAEALKDGHLQLEEVTLGFNEIRKSGAIVLVEAMANKINLKSLQLDGNQFGEEGKAELKKKLQEIGKLNVLGSLEDNESEESDENDDVGDDQEDSEESEEDEEQEESDRANQTDNTTVEFVADDLKIVNAKQFLLAPSADNFMALGSDRVKQISEEIKHNGNINIEEYVGVLMKVSALSNNTRKDVAELASECSEALYTELFAWAQEKDQTWLVNNYILINLGLIKDENKRTKPSWNLEGCLNVLKNVIQKNCIPNSTKNTLKFFMQRELENTTGSAKVKEILACVS